MTHEPTAPSSNAPRVWVWGIAVMCVGYFGAALPADDLGFVTKGSLVIEVDRGGAADLAGLQPGDLIVTDPVGFHRPDDRGLWSRLHRRAALVASGTLPYEIERASQRMAVTIVPEGPTLEASIRQLKDALPFIPTTVTFLGLAFLCARKSRIDRRARGHLAVGLALAGSYFSLEAMIGAPYWSRMLWAFAPSLSVLGYMLLAHVAWALSGVTPRTERAVTTTTTGVGVAFAVAIPFDTFAAIPELPFNNLLQWLGHGAMFGSIIAGLAVRWRRADEVAARRAARLTFVLVATGLLLPLVLVSAPYVFAGIALSAYVPVIWQAFVMVPIAFAATAARAGLVELDGRLPGVIVHAVVLGVAWLLYTGLAGLTELAFSGPTATEAGRLVGFAIVISVAEPLRAVFRSAIDRLFARDRLRLLAGCSRLCGELANIADPAAIELAVRNVLDAPTARLHATSELFGDAAGSIAAQLATHGALRRSDLPEVVGARMATRGFDTFVHIPEESQARASVLATAIPLAPARWDRAEREAIANVGQVIGSVIRQHHARQALQARVTRDEAERRGIAMELHDGLGATLTAARLMTQMARRSGAASPAGDTLDGLEETLQTGLRDLRVALWGLDERAMTWGELVARVRRHGGEMGAASGVEVQVVADLPEEQSVRPAVALAAFRVIQEAITNALKHAHASRIRCSLERFDSRVQLVVEDNGAGFPEKPPTGRGLGNMKRRLAAVGGSIQFLPRQGGGTRIEAWLPSHAHDHALPGRAEAGNTE